MLTAGLRPTGYGPLARGMRVRRGGAVSQSDADAGSPLAHDSGALRAAVTPTAFRQDASPRRPETQS